METPIGLLKRSVYSKNLNSSKIITSRMGCKGIFIQFMGVNLIKIHYILWFKKSSLTAEGAELPEKPKQTG